MNRRDVMKTVASVPLLALVPAGMVEQNCEPQTQDSRYDDGTAQLHVQLAGCLTAAEGHTSPSYTAKQGQYGWSFPYEKTLKLRQTFDMLMAACDQAIHELGIPGPGYPAPVANAYEILRLAIDTAHRAINK